MTGTKKKRTDKLSLAIVRLMTAAAGIILGLLLAGVVSAPVTASAALAAGTGIEQDKPKNEEDITEENGHRIIYFDKAGIVDGSEKPEVIKAMQALSSETNVIFYTTDKNEASSTSDVCASVCASYFGKSKSSPVVMFTIDMYHREIYMYCTGTVHKIIRSRDALAITDNTYKLASAGKYAQCAIQAYGQAQLRLNGLAIKRPMQIVTNALFAVMLGFLMNYIFLTISRKMNGAHKDEVRSAFGEDNSLSVNVRKKCVRQYSYYVSEGSSDGGSSGGYSGGGGSDSGSSGGGHSF